MNLDAAKVKEIRAWANANGHATGLRGRLSAAVLDAYKKAHDVPENGGQ